MLRMPVHWLMMGLMMTPMMISDLAAGTDATFFYLCRVMPLPPARLRDVAGTQGLGVTAFRKGLLPLRPGMSEAEAGALFSAYSR